MHTRHHQLVLPVLALVLAACGAGGGTSASPAAADASAAPPTPVLALISPVPAASSAPSPGSAAGDSAPTEPEAALLHGARLDMQGTCVALRTGLPAGATGAVACTPVSDAATGVSMVVFDTKAQLLDAYWAEVAAQGIEPWTMGRQCEAGAGCEGGYVPGDGHPGFEPAERGARWTDGAGTAHYLATVPPFLLLRVDGRAGATVSGVERYAWLGNQDQPGGPTLWAEEPRSPEK